MFKRKQTLSERLANGISIYVQIIQKCKLVVQINYIANIYKGKSELLSRTKMNAFNKNNHIIALVRKPAAG